MSRVLGIDASLTNTGLALVRHGELAAVTHVPTEGKRDATIEERWERLTYIANSIQRFIPWEWHSLDLAVIERPSFGSRGGSAHDRSGLWWLFVTALMAWQVPVVEVSPKARAKYIAGDGNAGKEKVLEAARAAYGDLITTHDEADAAGLAAMGARYVGEPVEHEISPAQQLAWSVAFKEVPPWLPEAA